MAIDATIIVLNGHRSTIMKLKFALFASLAALATPALAGLPVPSPEIGAGLAAMVAVGAVYAFLRRRSAR